MKKALIWVAGTIVFYFIAVFVFFILNFFIEEPFEIIWLSAIPVTVIAEVIALWFNLWRKGRASYRRRK